VNHLDPGEAGNLAHEPPEKLLLPVPQQHLPPHHPVNDMHHRPRREIAGTVALKMGKMRLTFRHQPHEASNLLIVNLLDSSFWKCA